MTVLLAFVGAIAFAVSFEVARQEAGNTLDDQLRQVAMNVGDGPLELHGPTVKHDAEDDFIIMVWDAAGHGKPYRAWRQLQRWVKIGAFIQRATLANQCK